MPDRPDLILIMTDQQRADQLGYSSGGYYETPSLDRLAGAGVVFDAAYSDSTVCVPSRMAMLTGLHHHRLPTQVNDLALQEGFWTVAHALRAAGYETALIGKMHFAPIHADHGFETMRVAEHMSGLVARPGAPAETDEYHDWLVAQGQPDWRFEREARGRASKAGRPSSEPPTTIDEYVHPTSWIEREAVSFLRQRNRSRPLFLVVSFLHPHEPYNPPEPYRSMYKVGDARLPEDGFEVNSGLSTTFRFAMGRSPRKVDPENLRPLRHALTMVRALINQIDGAVGRIVDDVDLSSTVLFFTSDHGDYAGHRGVMTKQPWIPFDDLARVPLLVTGHGVAGNRSISTVVQTTDFALTCLDYAGIEPPAGVFDGRSLRGVLSDATASGDPERSVAAATSVQCPMLRQEQFKLIRHAESGEEMLFDLRDDPGETVTLRDRPLHRPRGEELARLLDAELAQGTPDLPTFPPAS